MSTVKIRGALLRQDQPDEDWGGRLRDEVTKTVITIAIRLRYDDTTTHSTTTEVIEITIRLRYDDKATTKN